MNGKVYRLTLGTPEKHVPSAYAPPSCVPVKEIIPEQVPQLSFSCSVRGSRITLPLTEKTKIYGFGLQLKEFDHCGNKITIRVNADPLSRSGDSHAPVPFFVTNEGWGLMVDTARNAVFQCGCELNTGKGFSQEKREIASTTKELYAAQTSAESVMMIEVPIAQGVDVYFFTGEKIIDMVSAYNMLSGGGCMPPMWGLGNIYRCRNTFDQQQVVTMARRMRQAEIPCDTLGLEPGWQTHAYPCSFVWNETFPHPEAMLEELKGMGYHVNLWEHIFTHPTSPMYEKLLPYSGDTLVWKGLVPDLSIEAASDIYAEHHQSMFGSSIAGYKVDECDGSDFTGGWSYPDGARFPSGMDGEQYHHLVGAFIAKTMGKVLAKGDTLSQIRTMGAFASSYPFVLYSDLYDFDDFLTGVVNAGFSGLLWAPEMREAQDKEDLVRRLQLTVFSAQSLVNAWYLDDMPWVPLDAVDEAREILSDRMRFLPYLYTAFYDYYTTGKPPIRALVCDMPEAETVQREYLFGDLIVAPLAPHQKERQVWLPQGEWYDVFTGEKYAGGEHVRATKGIPVYAKAGTVLPLAEITQFVNDEHKIIIHPQLFGDAQNAICRLVEQTADGGYRVIPLSYGETVETERYRVF